MVEVIYPQLHFDLGRDAFVVWLRWVAMEKPPSPDFPRNQGIRFEVQINRNTILGPTIVARRDLEESLYLTTARERTREVLLAAEKKASIDVQLIIHGSIANAPFAALYHLRDAKLDSLSRGPVQGTPLLQLAPSTPGDQWHVAGQVNARYALKLSGQRVRLTVLRDES
jgi:hypothetical protein